MASATSDGQKAGNRKVTDFFMRYGSQGLDQKAFSSAAGNVAGTEERPRSTGGTSDNTQSQETDQGSTAVTTEGTAPKAEKENETPGSQSFRRQRIVKNGRTVIRSSDDEEDADSDSSLEEIGSLLALPKTTAPTPKKRLADDLENIQPCPPGTRARTSGRGLRRDTKGPSSFSMPDIPRYKYSLTSLVDQTTKDQASEAGVAQAREALELRKAALGLQAAEGASPQVSDDATPIDPNILKSVIDDGEQGGLGRLMNAMQRTEALSRAKAWHFFERSRPEGASRRRRPFPVDCLSRSGWQNVLRDPKQRRQAFLYGFVGEMAATNGPLPLELTSWMVEEFCRESRDDLRFAYGNALKASPEQAGRVLDPQRLSQIFVNLQASKDAIDLHQAIRPAPITPDSSPEIDQPKLLSVLDLIALTASTLSGESREHVICLLLRMLLDANVSDSIEVQLGVEKALIPLFDAIDENDLQPYSNSILRIVEQFTDDFTFREQLLKLMPCCTPRLHDFRRHLALVFFLVSDTAHSPTSPPTSSSRLLKQIIDRLTQPPFSINPETNYTDLAAMTSILDIALDDGLPPAPLSPSTPTQSPSEADVDFNTSVDVLARTLKATFTRIIDTGASHMTRTEAKENLDRVHARLAYAVRTKRSVKGDIFQQQQQRLTLQPQSRARADLPTVEVEGQEAKPEAEEEHVTEEVNGVRSEAFKRFFKARRPGDVGATTSY